MNLERAPFYLLCHPLGKRLPPPRSGLSRLLAESEYEIAKLVGALEAEGNNSGFDQFFYNSAGDNTAETIRTLETIGAVTVSDILKRAAAKFPTHTSQA